MEQKTTLSQSIDIVEQKAILENDFGIPMTKKLEGEVEYMCNLSDGVEQRGIEKGIKIGIEKGIEQVLFDLVRDNLISIEEAAKRANMTVEDFQEELDKK